MTRKLQVVTENSHKTAPKPAEKKLTVHGAAETGNRRALLVAMRDRIATDVDNPNTPARDLAALTRRLLEIAKDIEAIDLQAGDDEDAGPVPDEAWDASAI
jgi:hypothetical protein